MTDDDDVTTTTHPLLLALFAAVTTLDDHPDFATLEVTYELDDEGASSTTIVLHRPTHASPQP